MKPLITYSSKYKYIFLKSCGISLLLSLTVSCKGNLTARFPQPSATPTPTISSSVSSSPAPISSSPNNIQPRPQPSQNPRALQSNTNNRKPIIQQILTNPSSIANKSDSINLKVVAFDPDGDALKLTWQATKGHLSSNIGESISWQPQNVDGTFVSGAVTISVICDDNKGGVDSRSINLVIDKNGAASIQNAIPEAQREISVKTVETSSNEIRLDIGQFQQLTASAVLSDGSKSPEILWLSSNAKTVSVSPTGQIKRLASGDVVIFAKSILDPLKQQIIRITESVVPIVNPTPTPTPTSNQQLVTAPVGLTASEVTSNGFKVNWTAVNGALNYKVYSNGELVTTVSNPNFTFSNLNTNTPYSIQVSSVNVSSESSRSDILTVTTGAPIVNLPTTPVGINSSNLSSTGFKINWQAVNDATNYNLYINGSYINSVASTFYDISNLNPNTTYSVQLTSVNSAGESPRSTAINVTTTAPPLAVPSSPTGLTSSNITSSGFTLNWQSVNGATSYLISINGNPVTRVTSPSYTFTNLTASSTYSLQVSAENGAGGSPLSNALNVTTSTPIAIPSAPTGLTSNNITSNGFGLSWSPVNSASSYNIYRNNTLVATNIVATNYDSIGLNSSTMYSMQVSAVNSAGESLKSNGLNVNTAAPPLSIPGTPTGLTNSSVTSAGFNLNWNSVSGATSYNIYKDGVLYASNVTSTSFIASGLSASTTYSMQVSAVNIAGESNKSTILNTTTSAPPVTIPSAPTGLSSSGVTSSGFTLNWSSVSGANSYKVYKNGVLLSSNIVGTSFNVTGLNASTNYSMQVSAVNTAGESTKSTTQIVATSAPLVTIPSVPTSLAASNRTSSGFTLSWGSVSGATSYQVYINGSLLASNVLTTSYSLTDLIQNTNYSMQVIAVNSSGSSNLSNALNVTTLFTVVTTFAGSTQGYSDGQGTSVQFYYPEGIAVDGSGNLFVSDTLNNRIRKITPSGSVTTLAGGTQGYANGQGTSAKFYFPKGIAVDGSGNLFVADAGNHSIRKITPSGNVTTLAGDGTQGQADGQGTAATFGTPLGITIDGSGNLYVADGQNSNIRKITPSGNVTTLAGGTYGYADGQGTSAKFFYPNGITVDGNGNLYVSDNDRIRKITPSGSVTTLAGSGIGGYADGQGTSAQFNNVFGLALDGNGNLYVTDVSNNRIRKISTSGNVTTLAGGAQGYTDGQGPSAKFYNPSGISVSANGTLYVADTYNNRIRKITQ